MSKITNDGLTRSGTGCFITVRMWQQWASNWPAIGVNGQRLLLVFAPVFALADEATEPWEGHVTLVDGHVTWVDDHFLVTIAVEQQPPAAMVDREVTLGTDRRHQVGLVSYGHHITVELQQRCNTKCISQYSRETVLKIISTAESPLMLNEAKTSRLRPELRGRAPRPISGGWGQGRGQKQLWKSTK